MMFRHTLIAGASHGIGRAVALACARPGSVVHLCAREPGPLGETAEACIELGARVTTRVLDVCDRDGMTDWIGGAGQLDFVLANAGVAAGNPMVGPETELDVRAIFETNVLGMLNTVLPALAVMRGQAPCDGRRGRIAALASTAGFVAVPAAAAYCASKAAVDSWIVGQAHVARRQGVQLTSVCPGYVRTRMTAGNDFPMPGLMEPEEAARRILGAVARDRVRVVFPWWMGMAARLGSLLPAGSMGRLLGGSCVIPTLATLPVSAGVELGDAA
jgi:NAD(P)-dependent dehydrogenase (short-subunit alcohol dehydrogenase family)